MIVLDASVVTKWFFPEDQSLAALKLKTLHERNELKISAPILLLFELGSVSISKKVPTKTTFNQNFRNLFDLGINFIGPNSSLLETTFFIANQHKLSFYDATYVALAQQLHCDFITADKKLVEKTKNLKFVKLLSQTTMSK